MKRNIENREDIYLGVNTFYKKLMEDDVIFQFFIKIENALHLKPRFQIFAKFWSNRLFNTGEYRKNAMQIHPDLHQ